MHPRIDDDGSGAGPGIQVDLAGLRDFADRVRAEVDGSLGANLHEIFDPLAQGVSFGHALTNSPAVRAAQDRYFESLDTAVRAYAGFINAAGQMVTAVERIAREYGDADWSAAASAEDIAAAFAVGPGAAVVLPVLPAGVVDPGGRG